MSKKKADPKNPNSNDAPNEADAPQDLDGNDSELESEGNEDTVEMEIDVKSFESLQAQLAEAEAKSQDNLDKAIRAQAELENVRRRSLRDLENAHKFGLDKFLQDLLPIQDSLEMGIEAAKQETADIDKLVEGSELTLKMLADLLDKNGIEAIHPLGEPFDPEHHQAMTMLESSDHAPNTVVAVMQKGYKLNDRLVRPAMVAVSKESENSDNNVDEKA